MTTPYPQGMTGSRATSIPRTTHWLPYSAAPPVMMSGLRTADELTLTFSAPARRTSRISATEEMPPPTEKGMKICSATLRTVSIRIFRLSAEAVMS